MSFKILFSNLAYARGIDGSIGQHISHMHRHFYITALEQQKVLSQFKKIVAEEKPDLCCLIEIDSGSWNTQYFNQLTYLAESEYPFHDIAGKYGEDSTLAQMAFFRGKCSAFMSKTEIPFEKLYFKHGSKRLIYSMQLPGDIQLFFAHFSLQARIRERQFDEVRNLVKGANGEAIVLADFNILQGFKELSPLLNDMDLHVLNGENDHTFFLGRSRMTLDLCVCSTSLSEKLKLKVIPQPFSDHAAIVVEGDF